MLKKYGMLLGIVTLLMYSCESDLPILDTFIIDPIDTMTIDSIMEPTDTIINPIDTIMEPIDSMVNPIDTMMEPIDTMVNPIDTVMEPIDTMVNPIDTVMEPIDTMINPIDTIMEPLDTVIVAPIDTGGKAVFPAVFKNGLFIINEGQFTNANSSLDFYYPSKDTVFQRAYQTVNQEPLGDIFQSMSYDDDNFYLIINNSGKIIVVDRQTLKKKGEITGFPSPREMEYSGSGNLWYVSSLFSDMLYVVNVESMRIQETISTNFSSDPILKVNNKLYIGLPNTDRLLVKTDNEDLFAAIPVAEGATSLVKDNDNNLWLLCYGDFYEEGKAAIFKINTQENRVVKEINIAKGYPSQLIFSKTHNALFYLNTDVYKMDLDATSEPSIPHILSYGRTFHGISIDDDVQQMYITDAINFIERGFVYHYNMNGAIIDTISAGVVPNAVIPVR